MPLNRNFSLPQLQDPKQQQKEKAKKKDKAKTSKQEQDALIFN